MYFILSPGPYLFNLSYFCLSFTKTLLHTLHLKCIISVVLIALRHIFLSPEPYLFHLFDFVVFYIESTLLCYLHIKCLISIMLIVESATMYFLSPGPYPFYLFWLCCIIHIFYLVVFCIDSTSFIPRIERIAGFFDLFHISR